MKGKILAWDYLYDGVHSYMKKWTPYGVFESTIKLDEEDKDVASNFIAGSFCEYQCDLKAYFAKAKKFQRELGTIINFLNKVYDKDPYINQNEAVIDEYNIYFHRVKAAWKDYYKMKENYSLFVQQSLAFAKAFDEIMNN